MISVYQHEFENISKVSNVIPLATNVSHHTEASQSICRANQLVSIRWGILVFNGLTWNWKSQMLLKRDPWQVFFYEFCVIIQSSFIIQFHRSPPVDSFWHKANKLIYSLFSNIYTATTFIDIAFIYFWSPLSLMNLPEGVLL